MHVILKEKCSTEYMLKSVFQVNYLYWLERNMGLEPRSAEECASSGMLLISLDYVGREMVHAKRDAEHTGWDTHALIARPSPNIIHPPSESDSPSLGSSFFHSPCCFGFFRCSIVVLRKLLTIGLQQWLLVRR
jgi:hypothetical protein